MKFRIDRIVQRDIEPQHNILRHSYIRTRLDRHRESVAGGTTTFLALAQ